MGVRGGGEACFLHHETLKLIFPQGYGKSCPFEATGERRPIDRYEVYPALEHAGLEEKR